MPPPIIAQLLVPVFTSYTNFPNFQPLALLVIAVEILIKLATVAEAEKSQSCIVTVDPPSNNSAPSHIGCVLFIEF